VVGSKCDRRQGSTRPQDDRWSANDFVHVTEWSDGSVIINLGGLPGSSRSEALGINDAGVVGFIDVHAIRGVPEPSTWAMMLVGFAGLALTGYRRVKAGDAKV
jgi:hypothetical protein